MARGYRSRASASSSKECKTPPAKCRVITVGEDEVSGKKARRAAATLSSAQKLAKQDLDKLVSMEPDLLFTIVYGIRDGSIKATNNMQPLKTTDEVDVDPYWNARYNIHDKLPIYWIGSLLTENWPELFPTEFVVKIGADPVHMRRLQQFGFGFAFNSPLIKFCP